MANKRDFHEKVHSDWDYRTYRRRAALKGEQNPMSRKEFQQARQQDESLESDASRKARKAREKLNKNRR